MSKKTYLPNEKQSELLKRNGYEIIKEFGLVHDLQNRPPIAYVLWDKYNNEFYAQISRIELSTADGIRKYHSMLDDILDLTIQLNKLGGK